MGRISKPQKSQKHKKLKFVDPFYDGDRKERMHAGKNLAPVSTEQHMSRSMKDFMRRTKQAKEMNNKTKKQKKEIIKKRIQSQLSTEGAERDFQEVAQFRQRKGERESDFMRRVDVATMNTIQESKIEAAFKSTADPMEEVVRQRAEKKKQKLKVKKEMKKQKKQEKIEDRKDDFEKFKDEVKFGEVVHGLPSFSTRPKMKQGENSNKPAVKSLLLYDIIKNNSQSSGDQETAAASTPSSHTAKKGKRKLLTPSQQREMDRQRQEAIDQYRQIKHRKHKDKAKGVLVSEEM